MAGLLEGVVTHKFVETNGIKLHYVEAGSGQTVLLLHGFPDFWYGWRHQIPVLVAAGFHVVVPDLRGFGESEVGAPEKYSSLHIVGDFIGLLDALQVKQALVVGHDWGAVYGADLVLMRPDRVKALVLLSVTYFPRSTECIVDTLRTKLGDDCYICVFQEPGVAEELFKAAKNEDIFSAFYLRWNTSKNLLIPPFITDEPLPEWLTKEDLKAYAESVDKAGWTGGFNHYRAFYRSWEFKAPWHHAPLPEQVPVMTIMGKKDIAMVLLADGENVDEKAFEASQRMIVPGLKANHFIDAAHFFHQEKPDEVNKHILSFLDQYRE